MHPFKVQDQMFPVSQNTAIAWMIIHYVPESNWIWKFHFIPKSLCIFLLLIFHLIVSAYEIMY